VSNEELAKRRGDVDSTLQSHDEELADHADRIRGLEKFKQRVIGALMILGAIAGSGLVGVIAEVLGIV